MFRLSGLLILISTVWSLALINSCSFGSGIDPYGSSNYVSDRIEEGQDTKGDFQSELPSVPEDSLPVSLIRQSSSGDATMIGRMRVNQSGDKNRVVGDSYVISSSESGKSAWAWYTLGGLSLDRPVTLTANVSEAAIQQGNDPEPVNFYIGVANYCSYRWQWFGPFQDSHELTLNGENMRERFVSGGNPPQMHVVILTNSEAGSALQIDSLDIGLKPGLLSNGYFPTRPILMNTSIQRSAPAKTASELQQEHYVTLTWEFVPDPETPENEATIVRAYRRLVGESTWQPLGDANTGPIGEKYIDFADNDQPFHGTAGRTYEYILRFFSTGGFNTGDVLTGQIPLLAPTSLEAVPSGDPHQIELKWSKSVDASGYRIYRDDNQTPFAVLGDVDTYIDSACGNLPHTYWVEAFNDWGNSDIVSFENGYEIAALNISTTEYELGPGFIIQTLTVPNGTHRVLYASSDIRLLSSLNTKPTQLSDWNDTQVFDFSEQVPDESLLTYGLTVDDSGNIHLCAIKQFRMEQEVEPGDDPLPDLVKYHLWYARSHSDNPTGPEDWTFSEVDVTDDEYGEVGTKFQITGCKILSVDEIHQIMYTTYNADQGSAKLKYAISNINLPESPSDWTLYEIESDYKYIRGDSLNAGSGFKLDLIEGKPTTVVTRINAADQPGFTYFRATTATPFAPSDWIKSSGIAFGSLPPSQGNVSLAVIDNDPIAYGVYRSSEFASPFAAIQIANQLEPDPEGDWQERVLYETSPGQSVDVVRTLGLLNINDITYTCVGTNPWGSQSSPTSVELLYTASSNKTNGPWFIHSTISESISGMYNDFNGDMLAADDSILVFYDDWNSTSGFTMTACIVDII